MELEILKKEYNGLVGKYNLPDFEKLNIDFEIDKIDKDTSFVLRAVRKGMMEKIVNSLGFVEMLLNPVNASKIYFQYIKGMSQEDKKELDKIYSDLAELSFDSLTLEIDSDEKKEAELIKKAYQTWNSLKPAFRKIIGNIKKPVVNHTIKEKSYFG